MVPCPWFTGMAEVAAADSTLDLGIHLTLTSEWASYRWRPVSVCSQASGLVDDDGYFWRDVPALRQHLVVEAAVTELRTQIEIGIAAGLRPTHIDAHMAAAMLPELLPAHIALAREFGLVPVLPRAISFAPDARVYDALVAELTASGLLLPDHMRGTLPVAAEAAPNAYRALIEALPAGITHMALHCATPGDIQAISPQHAPWRIQEYQLFAEGRIDAWRRDAEVDLVGYRAIQAVWQTAGWG